MTSKMLFSFIGALWKTSGVQLPKANEHNLGQQWVTLIIFKMRERNCEHAFSL